MSIPSSALIVDDESHVRLYVKLLLGQLGVSLIFEAGNVNEARAILALHAPELVTLDINLTGASGLEFLRELRASDEETFIVMMSAETHTPTVKAAAEAGADAFLRKDLSREEILRQLRAVFE